MHAGIDPGRCVLVPDPGPDAGEALGALVDGFDVVAVGPCTAINDRDRRALSQRVRHRGAVLLSTQRWAGSEVTLSATKRSGQGLVSHGRLLAEELTVASSGRGLGAGRTRRLRISIAEDRSHLEDQNVTTSRSDVAQPRRSRGAG